MKKHGILCCGFLVMLALAVALLTGCVPRTERGGPGVTGGTTEEGTTFAGTTGGAGSWGGVASGTTEDSGGPLTGAELQSRKELLATRRALRHALPKLQRSMARIQRDVAQLQEDLAHIQTLLNELESD